MMAEVTQPVGGPSQGQPSVQHSSLLSCCLHSNAKSDDNYLFCSCENPVCCINH